MNPAPNTKTDRVICRCLGVTTSQITDAADYGGCESLRDLMQHTGAGKGCTACHRRIKDLLQSRADQSPSE